MIIDTLTQGSYQTNAYVLRENEQSKDCVIIDTGLDNSALLGFIENNKLNPVALVLTHGHLDHILGIPEVREAYPEIKVYIHKDDAQMLQDADLNMSNHSAIYENFVTKPADILLEDSQELDFANIKLKVLHVPGHTPGGICLSNEGEGVVFTGDCLFAGSVGRTDFPGYIQGKCHTQLINGLKEKVMVMPEETKLFPGHGPSTTVRCEKKYNPFINEDESII